MAPYSGLMAPADLETMGFGKTDITKHAKLVDTERKEKKGFVAGLSNARQARKIREEEAAKKSAASSSSSS